MSTGTFQAAGEKRPPFKLGVLLLIASETMIFAGFLSSYMVFRTGNTDWPPLGQPRLPAESTAFNTVLLLLSAWTTWMGVRSVKAGSAKAATWLGASAGLGAAFLLLQGSEWVALIAQGLTLQGNPFGAFFYSIVGAHGVHVALAVLVCIRAWLKTAAGAYSPQRSDGLVAFSYFWYFVVALWPPLYGVLYLW